MAMMMKHGPAPEVAQDSAAGLAAGGQEGEGELVLRRDFITTPLFVGAVMTSDGEVKIPWKLYDRLIIHVPNFFRPDNIGTFEIRAYAINSEGYFGANTANQIARKDLSILPSSTLMRSSSMINFLSSSYCTYWR